jgi:hypothetical protein
LAKRYFWPTRCMHSVTSIQAGAEAEEVFQVCEELNVKMTRTYFDWPDSNPSRGVYDWDATDAIFIRAHSFGMEYLVEVQGTPQWARPSNAATSRCRPLRLSDFSTWLEAFIRRYEPDGDLAREQGWHDGYGATRFEIGNESDDLEFGNWLDIKDRPDPIGAYLPMLRTAYTTIKAMNSEFVVVATAASIYGGLRELDEAPGSVLWLAGLYNNGLKDIYDVMSYHILDGSQPPLSSSYNSKFSAVGRMMKAFGDDDRDKVITEWGQWNSSDTPGGGVDVDEATHAEYVRMTYNVQLPRQKALNQADCIFFSVPVDQTGNKQGLVKNEIGNPHPWTRKDSFFAYRDDIPGANA